MGENKFSGSQGGMSRETVCVETNRILDSCRDRDCFEDVRVYLSDFGNEILERTGTIRAKSAEILWCNIAIDPIQFNRGFYAVNIRFYVRVDCEACMGPGRPQDVEGMAVVEKRVILFGGESGTITFRSNKEQNFCQPGKAEEGSRNIPTAVVETVDPILLGSKIVEKKKHHCHCCCCGSDMPDEVLDSLQAPIRFDDDDDTDRRILTVSLGIFSVVRITRPAELLIQASEYAIPEKECLSPTEDDPCSVFRKMPFPVDEFTAGDVPDFRGDRSDRNRCGCGNRD